MSRSPRTAPQETARAPARGIVLLAVAGALLLALSGCTAGRPSPRQAPPVVTEAAPARRTIRDWKAEGEIAVRLARFEGQASLRIEGAREGDASIEIERRGARLFVDGKAVETEGSGARPEAWVEARDPERGLTAGGARYPGRLRVRALAGEGVGLAVDNVVDLEDYVAGVVAREVQLIGAAPAELEAQAIAARSFALAQLAARGTRSLEVRLYDGTRDQAYAGRFVPTRDPASQRAAVLLSQAIERTRGQVLREDGAILDARFHAACGGRTADAAEVFPEAAHFESLRGVECTPCLGPAASPAVVAASTTGSAETKDLSWSTTLNAAQLGTLARALGLGASLTRVEPARRDPFGRWLEVELTGSEASRRVPFEAFRKQVPDGAIRSNLVLGTWPRTGEPITSGWMIRGRGRGHGVGLCQNGSRGEALAGRSAAEILARYYPGSVLGDGR